MSEIDLQIETPRGEDFVRCDRCGKTALIERQRFLRVIGWINIRAFHPNKFITYWQCPDCYADGCIIDIVKHFGPNAEDPNAED